MLDNILIMAVLVSLGCYQVFVTSRSAKRIQHLNSAGVSPFILAGLGSGVYIGIFMIAAGIGALFVGF